jgi:hypothetical protein
MIGGMKRSRLVSRINFRGYVALVFPFIY